MAHFAKISEENIVLNVVRVSNGHALDETAGKVHLGGTPLRGNFAGIGYTWDLENQIFLPPKDHVSWVLNVAEARWQSPIGDEPALTEEQVAAKSYYSWDESGQSWVLGTMDGDTN